MAAAPDGAWVACGSEAGHVVVLDRRAGRALASFRAHGAAVVAQLPVSRHELLTVAADKSAVLWRLSGAAPAPVAAIRGLPDYRGGLHAANVVAIRHAQPSPGGLLFFAANGHKACATRLPLGRSASQPVAHVDAARRHFGDDRGRRIHRHQLAVESLAALPIRRMFLLGCEDGKVRVAA